MKVCDKTCIFCFFPVINKYLCMAKRSLLSERPSYNLAEKEERERERERKERMSINYTATIQQGSNMSLPPPQKKNVYTPGNLERIRKYLYFIIDNCSGQSCYIICKYGLTNTFYLLLGQSFLIQNITNVFVNISV